MAALAALLIHVGLKLNKLAIYKDAIKLGANQYVPFFAIIIVILLTDLLKGISFGIVIGLIFVLKANFRSGIILSNAGNNYVIQIMHNLYFFNKAQLRRTFRHLPGGINLLIDGTQVDFIDNDIQIMVDDFCKTTNRNDIKVTRKKVVTTAVKMFRENTA